MGKRKGSKERERVKGLEKEVAELRQLVGSLEDAARAFFKIIEPEVQALVVEEVGLALDDLQIIH